MAVILESFSTLMDVCYPSGIFDISHLQVLSHFFHVLCFI